MCRPPPSPSLMTGGPHPCRSDVPDATREGFIFRENTMTPSCRRRIKRVLVSLLAVAGLLTLAVFLAWLTLRQGMDFRQLSISGAEIANLSIRLDKGLVLHAERIDIVAQTADDNAGLEAYIPSIRKWGHLIREIDIGRINYQNHALTILYRNGQFRVENDRFALAATITPGTEGTYHLELADLLVKEYNFTLSGRGSYDRISDRFHFAGLFRTPWTDGSLNFSFSQGQVDARVNTGAFRNLAALLAPLPIDPDVAAWTAANVTAARYRIKELRLRFPLADWRDIEAGSISGTAVAEKAAVRFHPGLDPVLCDRVAVSLHRDRLSFDLHAPRYKNRNLDGSSVYIDHLTGEGTELFVHIRAETRSDEDIHEILNTYRIPFPPLQLSGTTRADLQLTFALPEFTAHARGSFTAKAGDWIWAGILLHAETLSADLNDMTVTIREADVSHKEILRAGISGVVDIAAKHADLECDIGHLDFRSGEMQLLRAVDVRMPVDVDFGTDPVSVHLPHWQTTVLLGEEEKNIEIASLRAVAPVVPLADRLDFSEGSLHIALRHLPADLQFEGEIRIPHTPLFLHSLPVSSFRFQGTRMPGRIEASVNDGRISVTVADRATVRLRDYLVTVDREALGGGDTGQSFPLPLTVTGPRALLDVNGLPLPTLAFEFNAAGPNRTFGAALEQGRFLYEAYGDQLRLTGRELDAQIAGHFIKFADFTNGLLNVTLQGTRSDYIGYIEFTEALIRDYLVMNNIIAFVNTIPALATLSSPGFDQDGYRVQEGFIHFDVEDKLLTIRQLRADGITVNCEARGWVDFNKRRLDLSVELYTMKDYSRIIGLVPLAGYAILGEDGSLSTSLEITGSLDKPDIRTNLARDILLSPLNIIKRTVEWPFKQLEKLNGHPSAPPEPEE